MRLNLLRGTASCVVLTAIAMASGALAQAPDDDQISSVEEIVVTAQKREQSLQDVPVVVTALSESNLRNAGVRDIKDMQILTPGLTVSSTTSEASTTIRIRGVGTVGDNPGLESSVGVVIDGVYRPRNGVAYSDLGELQRVEVLKGPQGTLFGKNTSAGVVNVITKAPSFSFGAQGELTAGNYNEIGGSASVTGPITDKLAGRLFVAKRERDGYVDVRTGTGPRTETQDQDRNYWTVRGQLLLQPSDDASIRFIADYTKREENCCAGVQIRTGPTAAIIAGIGGAGVIANPAQPFQRVAYMNRSTAQDVEDKGVSAEATIDLPSWNATFTSLSAFRTWNMTNGLDADFTAVDLAYRPDDGTFGNEFTQFSQEFRLAGSTDRIEWLVGAFYAKEELTSKLSTYAGSAFEPYWSTNVLNSVATVINRTTGATVSTTGGSTFISSITGQPFGTNFPAGTGQRDRYSQDDETFALFTNNTIKVTDQFDVTVGLRYTVDEKNVASVYGQTGGSNPCAFALTPGGQTAIGTNLAGRGVPLLALPTAVGLTVTQLCVPTFNPLFALNGPRQQSSTDRDFSGTLKGVYRFSPQVMTYASYARGFKAGGFNLDRAQSAAPPALPIPVNPDVNTSFEEETVDSYELGMKTTWLGGRLLLNATAFHQTYTNFQLNTFVSVNFVVRSIPEVTSKGVDADLLWFTPIEGLNLQAGVTYADTKYGNFTPLNAQESLLPGNRLSFAPEWSVSGSVNWDRPIGGGLRGLANLSAKWNSEYNTASDLLPAKRQGAFTIVNARVGVGAEDGRWMLEAWAQNLLDEDYIQVGFNAFGQGSAFPPYVTSYVPAEDSTTYAAFLGQPRTYGVTLRVRY